MKGACAIVGALLLLTSCSSGPDEDAWRTDLDKAGVSYATDAVWHSYRDAWVEACKADGPDELVDQAEDQMVGLHETWAQVRVNVEHACPDRADELEVALG